MITYKKKKKDAVDLRSLHHLLMAVGLVSVHMAAAQPQGTPSNSNSPFPPNWAGHHRPPIEFNSSRTVKLNAVADGQVLSGNEVWKEEDNMEFVSGTMNEFVGHVFMGLCENEFSDKPGRVVEIDPVLGYPGEFLEPADMPGCATGMASDQTNGDIYASIYISSGVSAEELVDAPIARSEIIKVTTAGDVSRFAYDTTGCTGTFPLPGSPSEYAIPGDPGCFAYLGPMARSCISGDLFVAQTLNVLGGMKSALILRVSADGSSSQVYKNVQDCWLGEGADGDRDREDCNGDEVSRIVGMTIDCATDTLFVSRIIGDRSTADVLMITPEKIVSLASQLDGVDFSVPAGLAFHRGSQSLFVAEEGRSLEGHRMLEVTMEGEVSQMVISSRLRRPKVVIVQNNNDARLSLPTIRTEGAGLRGASEVDTEPVEETTMPELYVANSGDRINLEGGGGGPAFEYCLSNDPGQDCNTINVQFGTVTYGVCSALAFERNECIMLPKIGAVNRGKSVLSVSVQEDVDDIPDDDDSSSEPPLPDPGNNNSDSGGFLNTTVVMTSLIMGGVFVFAGFMYVARRTKGASNRRQSDLGMDTKRYNKFGGKGHVVRSQPHRGRIESTSTFGRGRHNSSYLSFGGSFEEPFLADSYITNPVPPHLREANSDQRRTPQLSNLLDVGSQFTLSFEDLVFEEQIGRGSSSIVYRGYWHNVEVAIKSVTSSFSCVGALEKTDPNDVVLIELQREAQILAKLSHPHIIRFHGISLQAEVNTFHLVMEMCDLSMEDLLYNSEEPISVFRLCNILLETALAMEFVHSRSPAILHRDLKPANILLASDGSARICDFGLSRVMASQSAFSQSTLGHPQNMSQRIGTPLFMAPEVFTSGSYSTSVDVFSFAVCAATFFARAPPFSGPETQDLSAYDLIDKILGGLRPTLPSSCPKKLSDLITQCWHEDPKCRPEFAQIVDALQRLDGDDGDCTTDGNESRDRSSTLGTAVEVGDLDTWQHGHQYRNEDNAPRVTHDLDDLDAMGRTSSLGASKMKSRAQKRKERVNHRRRHQLWSASPQMNTQIPLPKKTQEKETAVLPTPPASNLNKSVVTVLSFESGSAPHSRGPSTSNVSDVTSNDGVVAARHESKMSTDWHRSVINALRTESFDMRKMVNVPAEFTYSFEQSIMDEKTIAEKEKLALQLGTEWIYMQLVDLFHDLTALLNVFGEACTEHKCPKMSAGPAFTYCLKVGGSLVDQAGNHEVSAPRYINTSIQWIEGQLNSLEQLCASFETPELEFNRPSRASFLNERTLSTNSSARQLSSTVTSQAIHDLNKRKCETDQSSNLSDEEISNMVRARGLAVSRQIFVMLAHMYHSHLEEFIALRMHSHLNTTLRMFVLFNKENDLMPIDEMQPLAGIVRGILSEFEE